MPEGQNVQTRFKWDATIPAMYQPWVEDINNFLDVNTTAIQTIYEHLGIPTGDTHTPLELIPSTELPQGDDDTVYDILVQFAILSTSTRCALGIDIIKILHAKFATVGIDQQEWEVCSRPT